MLAITFEAFTAIAKVVALTVQTRLFKPQIIMLRGLTPLVRATSKRRTFAKTAAP